METIFLVRMLTRNWASMVCAALFFFANVIDGNLFGAAVSLILLVWISTAGVIETHLELERDGKAKWE